MGRLLGSCVEEGGLQGEAEQLFAAVRQDFIDQGNGYDAANLAEEMHVVFASEDIHREALVALSLFEDAAREERLTVEFLEDLALFLKCGRSNPTLRFKERGGGGE